MARNNQQLRTRKDLLLAGARLLKAGRTPSMDEVAAEALVSRATAYRYFPDIESLLVEAPLDESAPAPETLFADMAITDPLVRIDLAEESLHGMICRNEAQLRLMLARTLQPREGRPDGTKSLPRRQNRRTALIEEALAPVRSGLDPDRYRTLCVSLAIVFGIEAMIVLRDVLGMSPDEARAVKRWTVQSLVKAALAEPKSPKRKQGPSKA